MPPPIWRLFFSAHKVHTLPHENQQAGKTRPANAGRSWWRARPPRRQRPRRSGNPTLSVAEKKIAALEGAEAAVVTASGMAAISSALLATLKAGDELISTAEG